MTGFIYASTSLFRSQAQFLRLVETLKGRAKDGLLLYSLSHNTPDLEQSVKKLSSCTKETIGCISGLLPISSTTPYFSCSVAVINRGSDCTTFGSLKAGEGPVQVGRWHAFRKRAADTPDDYEDLASLDTTWRKDTSHFLPDELKGIANAKTFVYFSDNASYGLASALHERFPRSHQLGLAASSTPFITGRPFTLLRNGSAQSTGAVGVSISSKPTKADIQHNGLISLTSPLPVRRSEGNLIHELGDSVPARILLKAIQDHGLPDAQAKEVEFYIGIRDGPDDTGSPKLFRIVAGSPSRGSVALEEAAAPPVGSLVEFHYRRNDSPSTLPQHIGHPSSIFLGSLIENFELDTQHYSMENDANEASLADEQVFQSRFLMSSEHGFTLTPNSRASNSGPLKCTVPGTFGGLSFPGLNL